MDKKTRRFYSEGFKGEAVELSKRVGVQKAARELGISPRNLYDWKRRLPESPKVSREPPNGRRSRSDLEQENRSLRQENRGLKKENKGLKKENVFLRTVNGILKKTAAIFSADHIGGSR